MHARLSRSASRQIFPNFLGCENEDWRNEADQRPCDVIGGRLRGATPTIIGCEGIKAILENIEIKRAQIDRAEILNRMIDAVELKFFVPSVALTDKRSRAAKHPGVHFPHFRIVDDVAPGFEIEKIRERETKGIADFSVGLRELLHHRIG